MTNEELGALLVDALRSALADLDPARSVRAALPPRPPKAARVAIIAAGKAARAMTRGAIETYGDRIEDGLVVSVPDDDTEALPRCRVLHAAHPLFDARSVEAADAALARADALGPNDLLLALVSGGASSLLAAPCGGVSPDDKRRVVSRLLDAGAPIRDVNTVRRHLSRIKGGRLALAAAPARVLTLIVSDVIHGAPHDVGSGPTVADPTTVADARRVLERWGMAELGSLPLSESMEPGSQAVRARAKIIADPDALASRAALRLRAAGLDAHAEPSEEGNAADVAARRIGRARVLPPGRAVVIACEPTLELPPDRGRGGRAGYVALAVMRHLPADVVFLSAATDGVDGSSGASGALVSGARAGAIDEEEERRALAAFDDAAIHRRLGTHLPGGATGHNFADLHVLARAP
jgi:glycerate 2-kinase